MITGSVINWKMVKSILVKQVNLSVGMKLTAKQMTWQFKWIMFSNIHWQHNLHIFYKVIYNSPDTLILQTSLCPWVKAVQLLGVELPKTQINTVNFSKKLPTDQLYLIMNQDKSRGLGSILFDSLFPLIFYDSD